MKTTKAFALVSILAITVAAASCSSDNKKPAPTTDASTGGATTGTGGGGAAGASTGGTAGASTGGTAGAGSGGTGTGGIKTDGGKTDGGTPPPPVIGATEIDRMGRAGVNTALTDPFDTAEPLSIDQVKDNYNAASDPTTWAGKFTGYIETNLAILDGLDGVCGNQFAAGPPDDGGTANRYSALAGVLVDDQLYLNTKGATCTTYLAVEANATKIIPNADCGGRTLKEDVIDETYSLLAIGKTSGVTDGIDSDKTGVQTASFPFLAPPQ